MNILINILIISIFCNGWFLITHDGMVLDNFRIWLDSALPVRGILRALYKPFIGCIICYSSIWGTLIYYILSSISPQKLSILAMNYPIVIIGSAFANYFLFKLLGLIEKNTDA